eukprot:11712866-Ditylum_brightwellii.AAC.1
MQSVDVFDDFLNRKIGVRTIHFSYMTRATALASRPPSDHKDDLLHGEEFYFIDEELVAQATHTHPLYHEENTTVYYCLKEAVQALSMPCLSRHTSKLKMEGGFGLHYTTFCWSQ